MAHISLFQASSILLLCLLGALAAASIERSTVLKMATTATLRVPGLIMTRAIGEWGEEELLPSGLQSSYLNHDSYDFPQPRIKIISIRTNAMLFLCFITKTLTIDA